MKKISLVTGSSRGLGRDMAISLAKKNIDIELTYHTQKSEAEKVESEIQKMGNNAVTLQLDVSNISTFDPFMNRLQEKYRVVLHYNYLVII